MMCPIARGCIDYRAIRDLLRRIDCAGFITVEQERDPRSASGSLADASCEAPKAIALPTPPRPVGTGSGYMTRVSHAPVLILTAQNALAPRIAMAVRTAVAQRERRRNRR